MRSRSALVGVVVCMLAATPSVVRADEPDPKVERRREVFKSGMDDYVAGRYREAIGKWESVYRELELEQSYRLAFNLARAWDKVGDPTRASEYFETYLREVARRRQSEVVTDPLVEKQADDARARLAELQATHGRIQVGAGPRAVRIDRGDARAAGSAGFVVYVTPGEHVVTFDPKTAEPRTLTIAAGDLVTVDTPPLDLAPEPPPKVAIPTRAVTEHPFSPIVPAAAGGVALVSLVLPIALYSNALKIKNKYDNPENDRAVREQLANDYDSARTNAYVGAVVSVGFVAVAGALAAWYFLGAKERRVPDVTVGWSSLEVGGRF